MRKFLGQHLSEVTEPKEVEVEGKKIYITGPLSEVFTKALNIELSKSNKKSPTMESFTDPAVLARYIVSRMANNNTKDNPLLLYTFDKKDISNKVIVDAALAKTDFPDAEFIVIADFTGEAGQRLNAEHSQYYTALESIIENMGGHVVYNESSLNHAVESYYG